MAASEVWDIAQPGKASFERRNPLSGKPASRATAATPEDARAAADAAAAAFPAWAALGPTERRKVLLAAADGIEKRGPDFIRIASAETGGTPGWIGFNVHLAAGMLREAAAMTTQIGGEVIPSDKPGNLSMAVRQPVGVVVGIAPWNAPVILGVRALALPLACGNTVVLKASEICPATHSLIVDVLREAGVPNGAVSVVTNAPGDASAVVEALIAHPAVRRVNFTGSTRVGRIIAELGARYLKPVLLELGGKAPLIVLDDANLEEAAKAANFGAFMNQGQICMSTERLIVDKKVADPFAKILAAKAAALPAGNPGGEERGPGLARQHRGRRPRAEPDQGRRVQRRAGPVRQFARRHDHERDRARSRHAQDDDLRRGFVRSRGVHHPRRRRGGGDQGRQ